MPITHAIYLVSDTEQAIAFLATTFDLEVTADETTITGERFLTMGDSESERVQLQIVETQEQPQIASIKRNTATVDFIFETTDMEETIKRIEKQQLKLHRNPTRADYGLTAIFEDPFGNLWDLIQR